MDSLGILHKYWEHREFRPLQEEIINSVLDGRDTLALMPTGGGKSICFQVPALLQEGICIVITPLIALMKDQVETLKSKNIDAIAIFSGMTKREIDIALDNCIYGPIKFLYLSPERLGNDLVQERIKHMNVNLFAIDEAHCISQWGYDFRPPYLKLAILRELKPNIPFLALTATATTDVIRDIQDKLCFRAQNVLRKSFFRENLAYMALNEESKTERMLRIIRKLGGSGVIYVRNRRETQEVARTLLQEGISADFYHAGLDTPTRSAKQEAWKNNTIRVIVATNAFGMGIDKPDVRYVIHLDIPESLEAYYQEAGRAGRDGKKSYAVMLHHDSDRIHLKRKFELSFPETDFIQKVYQQLGNYYQLAYGAGEGLNLDFDISDFCHRYQLDVTMTLNAIKFLEKDGWISVTENVYLPSRLKFEANVQELYKFQVEHAEFDLFIKIIQRSYGGAFDYYVPIREYDLAKRTGQSVYHVRSLLKQLEKLGLISFLPQTDSPQLQFMQARVDNNHLYIDRRYIQDRKKVKEAQLAAIFNYLDHHTCRSEYLLQYFDEQDTKSCGICDLCIQAKSNQKSTSLIEAEIHTLLANGPLSITDLVTGLVIGTEKDRIAIVRQKIDEGSLLLDNGLYRLA